MMWMMWMVQFFKDPNSETRLRDQAAAWCREGVFHQSQPCEKGYQSRTRITLTHRNSDGFADVGGRHAPLLWRPDEGSAGERFFYLADLDEKHTAA